MKLVPIIGDYYDNWRYLSLSNFKFYDKWLILSHFTVTTTLTCIVRIVFQSKWNSVWFTYGFAFISHNLDRKHTIETVPDPRPDYLHRTPTVNLYCDPTISIFHTVCSIYSKLQNITNHWWYSVHLREITTIGWYCGKKEMAIRDTWKLKTNAGWVIAGICWGRWCIYITWPISFCCPSYWKSCYIHVISCCPECYYLGVIKSWVRYTWYNSSYILFVHNLICLHCMINVKSSVISIHLFLEIKQFDIQ